MPKIKLETIFSSKDVSTLLKEGGVGGVGGGVGHFLDGLKRVVNPLSNMLEISGMQVFFVLDTCFCQTENDDLKDAIIYFYPTQIPESQACSLCGQIFGIAQFFSSIFNWPKIVRLTRGKFALKKWGNYLFGLGSSSESSDSKVIESLEHICRLFCFYHKSIDTFKEACLQDQEGGRDFKRAIFKTWTFLLKSVKEQAKGCPGTFVLSRPICLFPEACLEAQIILESCQRNKLFLGGCVLYKNHLVISQIEPKLTFYLCHYYEDNLTQSTDFPPGINLTKVYLEKKDLREILSMNQFPEYLLMKNKEGNCFYETSYSDQEEFRSLSEDDQVEEDDDQDEDDNDSSFEDEQRKKMEEQNQEPEKNLKLENESKLKSLNQEKKSSSSSLSSCNKLDSMSGPGFELLLNVKGPILMENEISSLSSLYSVAEESLNILNNKKKLMEKRQTKKTFRNKKPKVGIKVDSFLSQFPSANNNHNPTATTDNSHGNSSVQISKMNKFESDETSGDSSFYEQPKDSFPSYSSNWKENETRRKEFEFISSCEAESPNYAGKQCPIFVPGNLPTPPTLPDEHKSSSSSFKYSGVKKSNEKVSTKPNQTTTSWLSSTSGGTKDKYKNWKEKNNEEDGKEKGATGGAPSSITVFDSDLIELGLCSVTWQNTSCLWLLDKSGGQVSPNSIRTNLTNCFHLLKKLDANLTRVNSGRTQVDELSSLHSISCDNLWKTITGEKLTKSFSVLDDFFENSNLKSLTAQTGANSVKYAHSSLTHQIYSETLANNNNTSTTSQQYLTGGGGIPSSKDTLSKVSQLNKRRYDKMGYYLLK